MQEAFLLSGCSAPASDPGFSCNLLKAGKFNLFSFLPSLFFFFCVAYHHQTYICAKLLKTCVPKKVYFRISGSGCRCRSIKFHFHLREGKVWNEQTQLIFQLEILDPFFHDDDKRNMFFFDDDMKRVLRASSQILSLFNIWYSACSPFQLCVELI